MLEWCDLLRTADVLSVFQLKNDFGLSITSFMYLLRLFCRISPDFHICHCMMNLQK